MNETLQTISQRTGYSVSTISRVLSGQAAKYRISAKAESVIKEEAERCGFKPSAVAKSLRMKKSYCIGLIVPSLTNPFFGSLATAIVAQAHIHDYSVLVVNSMEDETLEKEGVDFLLSRMVDGIIVAPSSSEPDLFETVNAMTPVVLIDRYFDKTDLPYVTTNNYIGAKEATELLINNGHKRIACIQGVPNSLPNKKRIEGYSDALKEVGLSAEYHVVGDSFSIECGFEQGKRLLKDKSNMPSAIFALSNTIVVGVLHAAQELGVRIPDDVSVVGFDDSPYLDYISTPITRICQPLEKIGKLAAEMIICKISNGEDEDTSSQILLHPSLIHGKSVKELI